MNQYHHLYRHEQLFQIGDFDEELFRRPIGFGRPGFGFSRPFGFGFGAHYSEVF